ncbi:MAG: PDZ domain-containing protein, partial [Hymenobacteraceae bacterium]|nr:PDZ domain-containing protein [Hymenobacteraceae bacterium]MDX5395236.1 PDZ domain-containing protein [Hymenobacteraceae bacterium]MDX5511274.1 PDZ domain-containing protein [Hymenobacteraceae bacterium]
DPRLKDSLQLKEEDKLSIIGAGEGDDLEAFITSNVKIEINGVVANAKSFAVLSEDVLHLSNYVGIPVHGILGYDFFSSFVVKINFITRRITLYKPETYRQRGNYISMPITIERNKPYVVIPTAINDNTKLSLKYIIDTGAGHALSLETESHPKLTVPKPALRAQVGRGLSGNINGYLGRIKNLELKTYNLKNVLASFPDHAEFGSKTTVARNGNIGLELLKRFHLILDYSRSAIYLKPNSMIKDPFEHDMSGIELIAGGENFHRYIIYSVHPGSPADEAGLKAGDEIISIDWTLVSKLNLTRISKLLHSYHGRNLTFFVKRGSELFTTTVTLQRQI